MRLFLGLKDKSPSSCAVTSAAIEQFLSSFLYFESRPLDAFPRKKISLLPAAFVSPSKTYDICFDSWAFGPLSTDNPKAEVGLSNRDRTSHDSYYEGKGNTKEFYDYDANK